MLQKKWLPPPVVPRDRLRRFRGLNPIVAQVLINRGFDDPTLAFEFLNARGVSHSNNPLDMPDMEKAVRRILHGVKDGESIAVYGDFDADGVTATTLMVEALRALGAQVTPYIPHRVDEGYGLNTEALDKLADEGVTLVITVDCGIRSIAEVEHAAALGLDIIVTDHHSLGPELPRAYAVVNPKRPGYAEPNLAGVGVAFKVAQALIMLGRKDLYFNGNGRGHNGNGRRASGSHIIPIETLYDLVAIGTVADLMPLNSLENRVMVRRGLELLKKAERPGVQALLDVAGVEPNQVSTTTIGFVIGPRINAAGRLDDAMLAYNLLAATTYEDALIWAEKLQDLNIKRQTITREAQAAISAQLQDEDSSLPLIFAVNRDLSPGVVGLVAGRLTEEFFRPAIVMEQGETESRASCRSIPQFDITSALDKCADLLVRHGGHALAAGFTVLN
ncbi:MAG: single-stranded-DNA-specific exonuclease RecJ, partial [Chloroflexota bacterium]